MHLSFLELVTVRTHEEREGLVGVSLGSQVEIFLLVGVGPPSFWTPPAAC